MEKPGRNDPCYCGSGKKYKQCHMAADLAVEREQRAWADAARDLRTALFEFADDERFDADAGEAANQYWNGLYVAENLHQMSPSESERFLDWFAFDYTLPSAGERVVDIYRKEHGDKLNDNQKALLESWSAGAPVGGYELLDYERQSLNLKDIVTGETFDLFEPSGHGNAPQGAIIIGRPIQIQDRREFFSMPAYIPPEEIADLREKLESARESDAAGDATEFMRRHNVLLIHHALDQAGVAGRPPVARLDPRHAAESAQSRATRHQKLRIKGPASANDNAPQQIQSHRKAI